MYLNYVSKKKVSQLKKGEYFTFKDYVVPLDTFVWVRGEYNRSSKRYMCHKLFDVNTITLLEGDRAVYTDFYFQFS